jgi:hypothetical protein
MADDLLPCEPFLVSAFEQYFAAAAAAAAQPTLQLHVLPVVLPVVLLAAGGCCNLGLYCLAM